jgi:hypothetical protein
VRQTLSMAGVFGGEAIMLTCREAAGRDRLLMAAAGFPRGSPKGDSGRRGHRAESQLPGAPLCSHWRPQQVAPDRPVSCGPFMRALGASVR